MRERRARFLLAFFLTLMAAAPVPAAELTFSVTPALMLPFLTETEDRYGFMGFGAFGDVGLNLANVLNVGLEGGFFMLPKQNSSRLPGGADPYVYYVPLGVQAGVYFFPFSRVEVTAGVAAGSGLVMSGSKTNNYSPWYRVHAGAAYRVSPALSVGLDVSWFDWQDEEVYWGNPAVAGLTAGVGIKYVFDTKKITGRAESSVQVDDSVFPLLHTLYKDAPFGTVTVRNEESAEIRDVYVWFRTENYTASDRLCGTVRRIPKHGSAEVPLYADFSSRILQFSEAGGISGEIVVEYRLLGKSRSSSSSVIIPVHNRNQLRWSDSAILASYISTGSQEVLEYSKYLVGVARNQLRTGLNRNLQFAMYLFEGMRLSGVSCAADISTPYAAYHLDDTALDFIQYPFQTLLYKSGDVDDVGVLLMALLESVGIPAAFIPLDDEFVVAFDLGISSSGAAAQFDGLDRVLVIDDEVWVPLSMSMLREGFMNSWYDAVERLSALMDGEGFEFIPLEEAWQTYPPAGFTTGDAAGDKPREAPLIAAVETDMGRYVTKEFGPRIEALIARIGREGESPELLNRLGLLYVRAGDYDQAAAVYARSAGMGSVSAMNNLGNIATIRRDYAGAKSWYERALSVEPANATALRGLNRAQGYLED